MTGESMWNAAVPSRSARVRGLVFVVLLVSASCVRSDRVLTSVEPGSYGKGIALPQDSAAAPSTQPGVQPAIHGLSVTPGAMHTVRPAGRQTSPPARPGQRISRVGDNALAYLRASTPKLVVELAAVKGASPAQSSLDLLAQRIRSIVDKPGGITFTPVKTIDTGGTTDYSVGDLLAIESADRVVKSTADTTTLWIVFLNGTFSGSGGVLGVTYTGSSIAIFEDRLTSAATVTMTKDQIERAVVVHETGHALGLENFGYQSSRHHEDDAHPGHSSSQKSVMFWAIEDVNVARLIAGGSTTLPYDFDGDDRSDLADRKAGRL